MAPVKSSKEWAELQACAAKLPNPTITDMLLTCVLASETPEEAREWFLLALLAVRTDAIQEEREWLRAKAGAAPLGCWVGYAPSLRAVCDVIGDRYAETFGVPPNRIVNLFAGLAGVELPS